MRTRTKIILTCIVLAAFLIRFWGLGNVPASPDWDEASLGYNAYSILHTAHDEYGKFLPVVFKSFNDYKPGLYVYLTIPSILLLGLNTVAVRLPSVLFGALSVLAVYFLIQELFPIREDEEKHLFSRETLGLVTAALLTLSPWHIQFSRVAFEANIGMALNLFGVLFFLKGLRKHPYLFLSAILFGINLMSYQSEKVFTPLLVLILAIVYRKELFKIPRKVVTTIIVVGLIAASPMILAVVTDPKSLLRAEGVSVFSNSSKLLGDNVEKLQESQRSHDIIGELFYNRRVVSIRTIIGGYLIHYDFNWLFLHGDGSRHHAPFMGLLYLWELPFLLIGIYQLLLGKWRRETKQLLIFWFLAAPIPASITTDIPHAVRTLNFLPTFQIFIGLGVLASMVAFQKVRLANFFRLSIYTIFGLVILGNIVYYFDQYFVQTNYYTAQDWQYGYEQTVSYFQSHATDDKTVVIENRQPMDQSYIFFLYYLRYDPVQYQKIALKDPGDTNANKPFDHFVFRPINWNADKSLQNTVFVGPAADFPSDIRAVRTVSYPNGNPAMKIVSQ